MATRVNGDVQGKGTRSLLVRDGTRVGGNLQFVENRRGPYVMTSKQIDGDLQFFKNRGSGAITGYQVGGNLQSKENSPKPLVRNNRVEGSTEVE
jgi:hypothetical protein